MKETIERWIWLLNLLSLLLDMIFSILVAPYHLVCVCRAIGRLMNEKALTNYPLSTNLEKVLFFLIVIMARCNRQKCLLHSKKCKKLHTFGFWKTGNAESLQPKMPHLIYWFSEQSFSPLDWTWWVQSCASSYRDGKKNSITHTRISFY